MTEATTAPTGDGPAVDFFDRATNDCPYHAYQTLRDEAPVWFDARVGMWVVTRYDDVKMILLDTERFTSERPTSVRRGRLGEEVRRLYDEKGWYPAPTLAGRDDPNHKQMRTLFNHAYRPNRIKELEPTIRQYSRDLLDKVVPAGRMDVVADLAVPLPLMVIAVQVGADLADIWKIKAWTDAWVQRLGMMQTAEEVIWSTEMEIEAQQYFQRIFERLRAEPDDTLLSDLVNTVIPEWGAPADRQRAARRDDGRHVRGRIGDDHERHLRRHQAADRAPRPVGPRALRSRHVRPVLVEEVLRLESPVQALFRMTTCDVELHGVTIPKGATVSIRYGAANRDDRAFTDADRFDLRRADYRQHVAFGHGVHHCLGAPLARRELLHAFGAVVERFEEMWFVEGANDFSIAPNYSLRALTALHIGFRVDPASS